MHAQVCSKPLNLLDKSGRFGVGSTASALTTNDRRRVSMAKRAGITAAYARAILDYNPQTGDLQWKERPDSHFRTPVYRRSWNSKNVGKVAGHVAPNGRIGVRVDGFTYQAHRLIWLIVTGEWAPEDIDHINGDPSDNRWVNLRLATVSQNMANARRPSHNTSGYKGVSWHRQGKKWRAALVVNGRQLFLGLHKTPEAAHEAYVRAAVQHFGEYARAG